MLLGGAETVRVCVVVERTFMDIATSHKPGGFLPPMGAFEGAAERAICRGSGGGGKGSTSAYGARKP